MKIIITIAKDGVDDVNVEVKQFESNSKRNVDSVSTYARFFDSGCPGWNKDSEFNKAFLEAQQAYANSLLRSRGHLFLNEVYDMLGIARSKVGQGVGWVYNLENPIGDNRVDFDIYNERNAGFVNGYENNVLLDFNVDGCILDRF